MILKVFVTKLLSSCSSPNVSFRILTLVQSFFSLSKELYLQSRIIFSSCTIYRNNTNELHELH